MNAYILQDVSTLTEWLLVLKLLDTLLGKLVKELQNK